MVKAQNIRIRPFNKLRTVIHLIACPHCGSRAMLGYKGRLSLFKCSGCHRVGRILQLGPQR